MKNECSIVRDILPLYVESMVSEETSAFVKDHLEHCADCSAEYEAMKAGGNSASADNSQNAKEASALLFLKKKIRKKRWISIAITAVCIVFLAVLLHTFPIYRLAELGGVSDFYSKTEVSKLIYIGSSGDRSEAQAVLRLADAAFTDCQHTREENEEQYGVLSRYATDVDRNAAFATHSLALLSAHLGPTDGAIWVRYTSSAFDLNGNLISGSSNILSLWNVQRNENGEWTVISIKEHP